MQHKHKIVQLHSVLGATVKSIVHMSLGMNQLIHVDCLHIHDWQKKLHRTAGDSPQKEAFYIDSVGDCACRFGILVADLSGPPFLS